MGTFVTQQATPVLFADGPKSAAPGISLPAGWTVDNITKAADLNALNDGLMDARTAVRGIVYNPLHYGCIGNGTTDDAASLQALLTAVAAATNSTIDLQGRTYKVGSALELFNTSGVQIANGVLKWDGVNGLTNQNILQFTNTYQCGMRNVSFVASTNAAKPNKASFCLHSDVNRTIGYGRSNGYFENCNWGVSIGEKAKYGLLIDCEDSASNGNNDFHLFVNCTGLGGTQANVSIEHHQSVGHIFINCKFLGYEGNTPYGIANTLGPVWTGGSFSVFGGGFSAHSTADIISASGNGATFWLGGNWVSEGSKRLWVANNVGVNPMFVTVSGGRFSCDSLNADRYFITCGGVSSLTVDGLLVDDGGSTGTTPPRILMNNGTVNDTTIRLTANHWNYNDSAATKTHPVKVTLGGATWHSKDQWYLQGNSFIGGPGTECRFDTEGVTGTATIADAATSVAVTFERDEPDANFFVEYFVVSKAGAPAAGSNRVTEISSQTKSGFTINVETAPGAGTSRTFRWAIRRYPLNT